ncbi:conserved phage virion protein [Citrobacter phage CR44b]|uniref:Conserved phage virion protein n=1 Tax=Citrobacter phage CR44b TaxID=1455075 RepID=W6PN71_9CAUD|nr:host range and adsorption protein [Citrobacter phage CR44b]CDM21562.1 conserved phage virion protein [Citrobacter phage CR44b]
MGKSISKAFKKVVNSALGTVGLGKDEAPKVVEAQTPAAPVEVPNDQVEDVDTEMTASDEKKVKRSGKRSLQVSRTSGGGISI